VTRRALNNQLLLTAVLLAATLLLFATSNLDLEAEDLFYNIQTGLWLLDRDDPVLAFIFYDGAKRALILFAVGILAALLFFRRFDVVRRYREGLVIVLLASVLVPGVVGSLKAMTNTPCPRQIEHYHGSYPDIGVFDAYPKTFHSPCKARCWPAGHASGGFALLSLFFLFKSAASRRRALLFALIVGWSMGGYKMAVGDHFLSHTLVTMLLAWGIILMIALAVDRMRGVDFLETFRNLPLLRRFYAPRQ